MRMRKTKIVCTVGPASREPETLRRLMEAGMDVARLNFSHGTLDEHRENVERIRAAASAVERPVAILADLQGPKFRMGEMAESGVLLKEGSQVTLTTEQIVGRTPEALPVQNEALPRLVQAGERLLVDDGLLELRVLESDAKEIVGEVLTGGLLKSNKGINLPGVSVDLPSLTDKDRQDLARALEWGADWIALSFVRTAEDVQKLKTLIDEQTEEPVPVMAKIEKPEALKNVDAIVDVSDAIMVARGDLGIEIPPEEVPMAQKRIIGRCNEAGVPVVIATQMLDSMIRHPRPTRAEASDVANAILDGADAVMLSGETSIGRYPEPAVRTLVRIIREVEEERPEIPVRPFRLGQESVNLAIARAVSRAARDATDHLDAAAVITPTASGYTARIMSRYRPESPIVAITPDPKIQRRLMLNWGVIPLSAPRSHNTDEMIAYAVRTAREQGLVQEGDLVVITAGAAGFEPGTTNLMRVYVVES